MLQPRIPFRRACGQCQQLLQPWKRSYAQVIEPIKPSASSSQPPPEFQAPVQDQSPVVRGEAALRRYKPRTPGVRHLVRPINDHLWRGRPLKSLTFPKKGHARGGRNHTGHVVVRHRGGGHKRRIRTVDFMRSEGGTQTVERVEYDPGRTAHIALVKDGKGKQTYILAAEGMRAGDVIQSYRGGLPQDLLDSMGGEIDRGLVASKTAWRGNCLRMGMIPIGTPIFNIAPDKDSIGKICRSAGTFGVIVGKGEDEVQKEMIKFIGDQGLTKGSDSEQLDLSSLTTEQLQRYEKAAQYVTVRLSSGEIRMVDKEAVATIGVASNANFKYTSLGKAGRKRWMGIRPTVRGLAMNAVDHPHGGGRGKGKGRNHPSSPWGQPAKSGFKTRSKHKVNKLVVQERPRNHGKRRKST